MSSININMDTSNLTTTCVCPNCPCSTSDPPNTGGSGSGCNCCPPVNSQEKNVTLSILTYYDTRIKKWTLSKINAGKDPNAPKVVFVKDNLAFVGEANTLYVYNDKIYLWDEVDQVFKKISDDSEPTWNPITK